MKRVIKGAAISAMAIIFLSACSDNSTKEANQASDEQGQMSSTNTTAIQVRLKDDKLNAMFQHYEYLTAALVKGNSKEARIAGNAIETGAKEVEGGATIAAKAARITETGDIEQQRAAFSALSGELIPLVKQSGLTGGQLYVDYCPMALSDAGAYWLSREKSIRNPYFGEKMITCGTIKETL